MEKKVLLGNEAIARGAYEAGCHVATAYPGTPSTEILETIARDYRDIKSQWSPNEKVALEVAAGASVAGARALAAMKHVGLNVAADPLFTFSYTGVNGGFVIINADDPGAWSSQNEQDNRHMARAAKVPMIEPSSPQECKEFTKLAFDISEQFDRPVIVRITTRIAHSQGIVELEREERRPGEALCPQFPEIRHASGARAAAPCLHRGAAQEAEGIFQHERAQPDRVGQEQKAGHHHRRRRLPVREGDLPGRLGAEDRHGLADARRPYPRVRRRRGEALRGRGARSVYRRLRQGPRHPVHRQGDHPHLLRAHARDRRPGAERKGTPGQIPEIRHATRFRRGRRRSARGARTASCSPCSASST